MRQNSRESLRFLFSVSAVLVGTVGLVLGPSPAYAATAYRVYIANQWVARAVPYMRCHRPRRGSRQGSAISRHRGRVPGLAAAVGFEVAGSGPRHGHWPTRTAMFQPTRLAILTLPTALT
jgi:hypothetical protein